MIEEDLRFKKKFSYTYLELTLDKVIKEISVNHFMVILGMSGLFFRKNIRFIISDL